MEPLAIQVKTLDVTRMLNPYGPHGRTTVIRLSISPDTEPRTVMIGHVHVIP